MRRTLFTIITLCLFFISCQNDSDTEGSINIQPNSFLLGYQQSTVQFSIQSEEPLTASVDADWISGLENSYAGGTLSLRLSVSSNPSSKARQAQIIFTDSYGAQGVVVINQKGNPDARSIQLSVNALRAEADTASLSLLVSAERAFGIYIDDSWVKCDRTAYEAGEGYVIVFQLEKNTSFESRTSTVWFRTIDGEPDSVSLSIRQAAHWKAELSLSDTVLQADYSGGQLSTLVSTDTLVTIKSNAKWVACNPLELGPGRNQTVEITVNPNETFAERAALITFTATDSTQAVLRIKQAAKPASDKNELLSFRFSRANNPILEKDIELSPGEQPNTFEGRSPTLASLSALKAEFTTDGYRVTVNGVEQESGVTVNDFSKPVTYQVMAENGSIRSYTITLMRFTGLPILYIDTYSGNEIASKDVWEGAVCHLEGNTSLNGFDELQIEVKGRGNSSWGTFLKKRSYNMRLPSRQPVLGMPEHKRWCLIGNYRDKTLMRNSVAFKISQLCPGIAWTPRSEQVELILNGTHRGTYLLCEQIRIDENRVNINEMAPTETSGAAITGGYILEIDQYGDGDVHSFRSHYIIGDLTSGNYSRVNVKIPDKEDGNSSQFNYIENYFHEAEEAICNNGGDFSEVFSTYVDMNSFIDDWFVYELTATPEPARGPYSLYLYKDKDDPKFYAGPPWDFDFLSFVPGTQNSWVNKKAAWWKFLFRSEEFRQQVRERWNVLYPKLQTDVLNYIDEQEAYLKYSAEANWAMYDLEERSENGDEHIPSEDAIERMRTVFEGRIKWINTEINSSRWMTDSYHNN